MAKTIFRRATVRALVPRVAGDLKYELPLRGGAQCAG